MDLQVHHPANRPDKDLQASPILDMVIPPHLNEVKQVSMGLVYVQLEEGSI
jgi:hypothetical protein